MTQLNAKVSPVYASLCAALFETLFTAKKEEVFPMDEMMLNLLVSLVLTAIIYMAFPLIRLAMNHGRFERKRARRIALWNSIILGAFFCIANAALSDGTAWSATPALLYYWINCALLTNKNDETDLSSDVEQPTEAEKNATCGDSSMREDELHNATPVVQKETLNQSSLNGSQCRKEKPILFCRKCGNRLVEGYVFCNKCGTKISTDDTAN